MKRLLFVLFACVAVFLSVQPASAQTNTCTAGVACKIAWDIPTAAAENVTAESFYVEGVSQASVQHSVVSGTVTFTYTFGTADVGTKNVQASTTNAGGTTKSVSLAITVLAPPPPSAPINGRVTP